MDSGQCEKWIQRNLQSIQQEKIRWEKDEHLYRRLVENESSSDLLSLNNLTGVIYMFCIGTGVSIFVFVVEYFKDFVGHA